MPTIYLAEYAGACFGVNRALALVEEERTTHPQEKITTLGMLIHNPRVVGDLADRNINVIHEPQNAAGGLCVLRTHGVPQSVEQDIKKYAQKVLDATCPFVKRVHKSVEDLESRGYQIIILGEKDHPETIGTLSHAKHALVIEDPADIEKYNLGLRVGIVVQTTQSRAALTQLVTQLLGRVTELLVVDTICDATTKRQSSAKDLAQRTQVMVVIGGKMSANTTRLAELCQNEGARTHHIEDAQELNPSWFAGVQTVGVTAGASTPQTHIDEVIQALKEILGKDTKVCMASSSIPSTSEVVRGGHES